MKPIRISAALAALVLLSSSVAACGAGDDEGTDTGGGVVVNEVDTEGGDGGDWVELANTGSDAVDVSGWGIADDDHDPLTVPDGSVIDAGGHLVVHTDPDFSLGSGDSVTLTDPDGAEIDSTSWTDAGVHARVPDATGGFSDTDLPTPGLSNDPAPSPADQLDTGTVDLTGEYADDFDTTDMSGVDIADDGTVYVVNNAKGTLYVLTPTDDGYSVDAVHQLRYPDGSGEPDAEGVTVGPDGAVYVSTERDGEDDKVSRPSVLRFDTPESSGDDELTATDEWDLADLTGDLDPNKGLEAISWISDASSPDTFAVGVEGTAEVLFVTLDGTEPQLVQRYRTPLGGVMGSDYDATTGELTVACDETCDGASQVLARSDDGQFAPVSDQLTARPASMDNVGNEGYATATVDGATRYLWTDDSGTDGVSLRGAVG